MNGTVAGIFICPVAGGEMRSVEEAEAIAGSGLVGDRYATGNGTFNQGKPGTRQVTLINGMFFEDSGFQYAESRRNIITLGVELMWLIDREFRIGKARFRGVKYNDPCDRPSKLAMKSRSYKRAFFDRGGLIAEVIGGGVIRVGDLIIPPPKNY